MVIHGQVESTIGSAKSSGQRPFALDSEEGNALVEFLFCFPFVLLVFISSIDLGRALNAYFGITRIVYEGARYAGQVGGLETGTFPTVASATAKPGHLRVRSRVDNLMLKYNINPGVLPSTYLSTACIQTAGQRDSVRVSVSVTFDPIFPLFQSMLGVLSTDATGPYLFTGCN